MAQTFTYFDDGSLQSKSNAGVYTYPPQGAAAIRPHAVQSISGIAGSFVYDDNGNMTNGAGRSVSWTSFDMPVQIAQGTVTSNFVYGPEHQRTKQTRSDGTTIVYAGAQEVETKAGVSTVKTYWPGGIGVEIERGAVATELDWTHLDRLGSPIAISDQNGVLKEKMAYDAWGKRRNLSDSGTPNTLDGVVDNKGYTGHEMLDQLDLVHMNGRVYDPLVAKFLSGDPFVQDPINGQSYNRYSYVLNNPTNLTDPTGFQSYSGDGCEGHKQGCASIQVSDGNLDGSSTSGKSSSPKADVQAAPAGAPVMNSNSDYKTDAKNPVGANSGTASAVKYDDNGNPMPGDGTPLAKIDGAMQNRISQSLSESQRLAHARVRLMQEGKSDADLELHFFDSSKEMSNRLLPTAEAISSRLDSLTLNSFRPSSACMPGCVASATNPKAGAFILGDGRDDAHIYLNSSAFDTNKWSLTRIIIHEASHFWNGGNTRDWDTYGFKNSLGLRNVARRAAQTHADTWSYFITGDSK